MPKLLFDVAVVQWNPALVFDFAPLSVEQDTVRHIRKYAIPVRMCPLPRDFRLMSTAEQN